MDSQSILHFFLDAPVVPVASFLNRVSSPSSLTALLLVLLMSTHSNICNSFKLPIPLGTLTPFLLVLDQPLEQPMCGKQTMHWFIWIQVVRDIPITANDTEIFKFSDLCWQSCNISVPHVQNLQAMQFSNVTRK